MFQAEIKGKLPEIENWEDILTSNVFSLLEFLNDEILLSILEESTNFERTKLKIGKKQRKIKKIELWEKNKDGKEPDIFIELAEGHKCIIEVKYRSDESSEDQLLNYLGNVDFLVYLTREVSSAKETLLKYKEKNIYWISWDKFNEVLCRIEKSNKFINIFSCECQRKILKKIIEYLRYRGFEPWDGWPRNLVSVNDNCISFFSDKLFGPYERLNKCTGGFFNG